MAWTTDLVLMTRVLINDVDSPQKYTDSYLQQTIVTAGIFVNMEIELPYTYSFDVGSITISPDPISDSISKSLFPLKAACILTIGEFKKALGQGIKVRDGDSSVDTSVSFRGYRDILELGPCTAYNKLKWQIQAAGVGSAVLGPHRSSGNSAIADNVGWYYDEIAIYYNGR